MSLSLMNYRDIKKMPILYARSKKSVLKNTLQIRNLYYLRGCATALFVHELL